MRALASFIVLWTAAAPAPAGDLTPPAGPVAPTMKTLEQVEPRTPLGQTDVPIVITEPGSYYLTESLGADAIDMPFLIRIEANEVAIDLRGFTLDGGYLDPDPAWARTGIEVAPDVSGTFVRDGFIRDITKGIDAISAIGTTVSDVHCAWIVPPFPGGAGIAVNDGSAVLHCTVDFTAETGIVARGGCYVHACALHMCSRGISVLDGCLVDSCTVVDSAGNGIRSQRSVVRNCVVRGGTVGVYQFTGGSVIGCEVTEASSIGIQIVGTGGGVVRNNSARQGLGSGIQVSGERCRIEGNTLTDNAGDGLLVSGTDSLIVRNAASGSGGMNYNIGAGNSVGTITNTPVGAGAWDNFEY